MRNNTAPYMLPIDHYTKDIDEKKGIKIKLTSPAEQVVEQAKSEVKREMSHGKKLGKRKTNHSSNTKSTPKKQRKILKINSDVFGPY